ncbi:hypothetical protein PAECIP111893_00358 [Paenibacillus plantiphilus]|uniref:DUF4375 domain-containing protein n=1 Tax=Paenibacillus plantiphilus TaxID=2905650 RepID=A0ABN8FV53_9BACL|nr:hypothetical protein [Paenibacillus plantiphilus]CAH1192940.1 hypothetical protein PAECIP111893_00358 [Paenibacillus plantiphilus]
MKLYVDDHEINRDFDGLTEFDEFWKELNENFKREKKVISSAVIDGLEQDDYNQYIVLNFSSIKVITLNIVSYTELTDASLNELIIYNKKIITACDSIGSLFYGDLTEREWGLIESLMQGYQWIHQCISGLIAILIENNSSDQRLVILEPALNILENQLQELDGALQGQQYVIAGDIIKYELIDVFKVLDEQFAEHGW